MFSCKLKEYLDNAGHDPYWFIKESGLGCATVYNYYRRPIQRVDAKVYKAMKRIFGLTSLDQAFQLVEED